MTNVGLFLQHGHKLFGLDYFVYLFGVPDLHFILNDLPIINVGLSIGIIQDIGQKGPQCSNVLEHTATLIIAVVHRRALDVQIRVGLFLDFVVGLSHFKGIPYHVQQLRERPSIRSTDS
jgi:hypothetical protein